MNTVIFCDADGVVFNFAEGACLALGLPPREPTTWNWFEDFGLTESQFWDGIHRFGRTFYEDMVPLFPWAHDLLKILGTFGDVVFLTRMSPKADDYAGKFTLLQRHFPKYPVITMSHDNKHLLAGPSRILVDDNNDNVESFGAAGGYGIYFPQPYNKRKDECHDRLGYVASELSCIELLMRCSLCPGQVS